MSTSKIVYLNFRSNHGIETVDQIEKKDYDTAKEFRKELNRLVSEYSLAGMNVYLSQRCCKAWNE
jgi:hypothetical protein